jgi:transposase
MPKQPDEKEKFLEAHGTLHPHPESVQDQSFQKSPFFDPRDLVQVRYEMLRRHLTEGRQVTEVVRAFGLSRQFFYRLVAVFRTKGIYGLLPRKRGPKSPHKCSEEVVEFAEKLRQEKPELRLPELLHEVEAKFQIDLHPRTLEKALAQRKKKRLR